MHALATLALLLSTLSLALSASLNGACTGAAGHAGVCISTSSCTSSGGKYISNACPGTPDNIKCCTKPSCGPASKDGNCRWTSQCSSTTSISVAGLCPGPDGFKCCQKKTTSGGGGEEDGESSLGGSISRAEIVKRGQYWIKKHVPYSMYKSYPDINGKRLYRTDCSGFVSMALHTSTPGRTTTSLLQIAKSISWDNLLPGDFVGTLGAGTGGSGGHVTLFLRWANSSKTRYVGLECRGKKYGCIQYERARKWKVGSHVAKPYRYINVK